MSKTIYELDLHEAIELTRFIIVRVPGGWIYRSPVDNIFIPFHRDESIQKAPRVIPSREAVVYPTTPTGVKPPPSRLKDEVAPPPPAKPFSERLVEKQQERAERPEDHTLDASPYLLKTLKGRFLKRREAGTPKTLLDELLAEKDFEQALEEALAIVGALAEWSLDYDKPPGWFALEDITPKRQAIEKRAVELYKVINKK